MSRYRKLRGLMIRSLTTTKGPKENVGTNVTATTNGFTPTCRKCNPGGLRNSSRFLLEFQRSVWTGLRGSIGHGR